jgi:chromosome segregation ATPase
LVRVRVLKKKRTQSIDSFTILTNRYRKMKSISSSSKALSWIEEVNRVSLDLENIEIKPMSTYKEISGYQSLVFSLDQFKAFLSKAKPSIEQLSRTSKDSYNHMRSLEEDTHDRFRHIVEEYNQVNEKVTALQKSFASSSDFLNTLNEQLATVRKENEEVKRQVKEKSEGMMDNTPVLKIKSTLKTMKEEIRGMDLDIGILEHSLLHRNRLSC